MILRNDIRLTMMFIIHKVGLILLKVLGLGDFKEVWLLVELPLVYKEYLIVIWKDSKQYRLNMPHLKIWNKSKYIFNLLKVFHLLKPKC